MDSQARSQRGSMGSSELSFPQIEIALFILSIAKLCANFEIAYVILKSCNESILYNSEMEVSEQDTCQCWIHYTANYSIAHYIHFSS